MPKVSVVIATYNRAHYIREAIDSVLAQSYSDYEIIVVDDGSTDKTRGVIADYGNKVRYFHTERSNQPTALNFGIRQATGSYIAFLDDDDRWLPNKLEIQMNTFEANHSLGFVCSETYHTNADGEIIHHWKRKKTNQNTFESLYENNFISHCVVIARKDFLDAVGGFDGSLVTTQDYDLWLRLAKICTFEYIDQPLALIRFHAHNKHKNRVQKLKDRLYVLTKPENTRHLNLIQKQIRVAKEYYEHGNYFKDLGLWSLAGMTYFKAILTYPAIGQFYRPEGNYQILQSIPYRILRPYLQSLYWLFKGICRTIKNSRIVRHLMRPINQIAVQSGLTLFAYYLAVRSFFKNEKGIYILMYHRIRDDLPPSSLIVSTDVFRKHLNYFKKFCEVLDMNQFLEMYTGERKWTPCRKPRLVITIDDGYRDNYLNAFPLLKEFGLPATIFLATGFIGTDKKMPRYAALPSPDMLSWEEISDMRQHGITFCAHTESHPRLLQLTYEQQKSEIENSIHSVYAHFPEKVVNSVFSYTYGQYNQDTLRVMRELGIKIAVTVKSGINLPGDDPLELKRICVEGERPLNKVMRQLNSISIEN